VTLLLDGDRALPEADQEISQRLGKLLHDAGVDIKRRATIEAIHPHADGTLAVVLAEGKGQIVVDKVLAARRLPNSTGLGLRDLGCKTEQGGVLVNERMETSVPHVYAVGDVTSGPMWSHKANAEGIVAGENAMGRSGKINYHALPRCLYTWPEVAWAGLTEEQAEAQHQTVSVGQVPLAINPYAMLLDETAGVIKILADVRYGKILGVHIMAPGAVSLIDAACAAMLAEATVGELMHLMPMHPAIGEALLDAALDVEKRSLHMPKW
jgi:dihydrolipoamide dehydrogenase